MRCSWGHEASNMWIDYKYYFGQEHQDIKLFLSQQRSRIYPSSRRKGTHTEYHPQYYTHTHTLSLSTEFSNDSLLVYIRNTLNRKRWFVSIPTEHADIPPLERVLKYALDNDCIPQDMHHNIV
mmetsp:Transcript_2215/g.3287  ORF Transcript_2215/g.3287 Transcript_2215/m.3287 type:complete len:123 (+) Transcript_2215:168-536(+)